MTKEQELIYNTGKLVGERIGLIKGILIGCLGILITILMFIL